MTEPTQPARPRRRWLVLSVRSSLLLILILGLVMGWFVHQARVKRLAVASILRAGGSIRYDWDDGMEGITHVPQEPPTLNWWQRRLGPEYFENAIRVDLIRPASSDGHYHFEDHFGRAATGNARHRKSGLDHRPEPPMKRSPHTMMIPPRERPGNDADLAAIAGLTRMEELSICGGGVTDAGLSYLPGMTNLRSLKIMYSRVTELKPYRHLAKLTQLDLEGTPIDDAGLAAASDLPWLSMINLDGTKVTDVGLAHLAGHSYHELSLNGTRVTGIGPIRDVSRLGKLALGDTPTDDAGLAKISGARSLHSLCLDGTKITDAGLVHLRQLTSMNTLHLGHTRITDAGLANLSGMAELRDLSIEGTEITDAGLAHLAGLKHLDRVVADGTRIMKPDGEPSKALGPGTRVWWSWAPPGTPWYDTNFYSKPPDDWPRH